MPPRERPDRPAEWPAAHTPWVEASRYVQALAEEHGIDGACRELGVDLDVLTHVAEQRALVSMLVHSGRPIPDGLEPAAVLTDVLDRAAMIVFQACYMDGLVIGYQARVLEERQT